MNSIARVKVLAVLSAFAIASACGNGADKENTRPNDGVANAADRSSDDARDGRVEPPPRPVCFRPKEPPTVTARYVADDAETDAGPFDAGAGGRVVEVDIDWTRTSIVLDSWESVLNAVLLDAVTTDERGRLIVAVPADASSAALSLFISCNPHLGERVGIALELEPSSVNGSVSVGY